MKNDNKRCNIIKIPLLAAHRQKVLLEKRFLAKVQISLSSASERDDPLCCNNSQSVIIESHKTILKTFPVSSFVNSARERERTSSILRNFTLQCKSERSGKFCTQDHQVPCERERANINIFKYRTRTTQLYSQCTLRYSCMLLIYCRCELHLN